MTTGRDGFEYAVLRVVPRVDRGEAMNAGVLLYCQAQAFLGARVHLDRDRLRALDPAADADAVEHALRTAAGVCDGVDDAGPAAEEAVGLGVGILGQPGVHRTGLDDGAARRGQPAEP